MVTYAVIFSSDRKNITNTTKLLSLVNLCVNSYNTEWNNWSVLSIEFEYILKSACAISMDTKYYMCYKTLDPSMLPSKTTPFHYDRKSVVPHYGCHVP